MRNFSQISAILLFFPRNFPQFIAIFRNFSDLPIFRATVTSCCVQCPLYSCCSCWLQYRNFPAIFRNFPQFFAIGFDPCRPQPPPPCPSSQTLVLGINMI